MLMSELRKQYVDNVAVIEKTRLEIDEKITKKRASIARAEKAIEKLNKQYYKNQYPSWIDQLVKPLAEELSKEFGMDYEIYGPFGLNCETSIYWREEMGKSISVQPTISLTLTPGNLQEGELYYYTGRLKNEVYAENTIGAINGFNKEKKLLPDSIEKIKTLVEYSEE